MSIVTLLLLPLQPLEWLFRVVRALLGLALALPFLAASMAAGGFRFV